MTIDEALEEMIRQSEELSQTLKRIKKLRQSAIGPARKKELDDMIASLDKEFERHEKLADELERFIDSQKASE